MTADTARASDAIPSFIKAMEAAGLKPMEPVATLLGSGNLVRFRAEGDKPGRRNAWAVLHLDGVPAGAFGSYRLGVQQRWCSGVVGALSEEERRERAAAVRKAQAAREAEIAAGQQRAAAEAERIVAAAAPARPDHPYLARKGITGEALHQLGNRLIVPMRDHAGRLWNVQRIGPDGTKLFLKGGRTDGLFWHCGTPDAVACIGEGMATMAVVRRATGHAVVAAFGWKNLAPVVRLIAAAWPSLDLIVCADDDAHLIDHPTIKRNLGLEAARAAAVAVGARLAVPPRSDDHE